MSGNFSKSRILNHNCGLLQLRKVSPTAQVFSDILTTLDNLLDTLEANEAKKHSEEIGSNTTYPLKEKSTRRLSEFQTHMHTKPKGSSFMKETQLRITLYSKPKTVNKVTS